VGGGRTWASSPGVASLGRVGVRCGGTTVDRLNVAKIDRQLGEASLDQGMSLLLERAQHSRIERGTGPQADPLSLRKHREEVVARNFDGGHRSCSLP
jgi:hypothetical protein